MLKRIFFLFLNMHCVALRCVSCFGFFWCGQRFHVMMQPLQASNPLLQGCMLLQSPWFQSRQRPFTPLITPLTQHGNSFADCTIFGPWPTYGTISNFDLMMLNRRSEITKVIWWQDHEHRHEIPWQSIEQILSHFSQNHTCPPHGRARGSPKLLGYIVWAPWRSLPNSMEAIQ